MFGKYSARNIRARRSSPFTPVAVRPPTEEELAHIVMPEAAQAKFLLLKPSPPDARDLKQRVSMNYTNLPISVDLTPLLPPAMDQGGIGSCAAHAAGLALRYLYKKQLSQDWMPSRLALYYVTRVYMTGDAPTEDTGCYMRDVCKAVAKYNLPPEVYWRYDESKFTLPPPYLQQNEMAPLPLIEYRAVDRTEYALKFVLSQRLPVILGIALYESFMSPTVAATGTVPMPSVSTEQCLGGHAVVLVAYNSTSFTCRNSWSSGWGYRGNFTLPIAYLTNPNLCFDAWVLSKALGV